jgi:hypothetical protein
MKHLLLKPFIKVRDDFQRQVRWSRMSDYDRNILMAEKEMVRAHARWQSLLAAKKADEIARAESRNMIQNEYDRFNFEAQIAHD